MSIAADILTAARASKTVIATAESCTGGLVAAALTEVPGSSDVVDRGFVTYSNAAKQQMLGVLAATLETHGAVSEATAAEMALGARKNSDASLTIAVTGIAGPGGSDHKPEGRVCFAIASQSDTITETVDFGAIGRGNVRAASTEHALQMLLSIVQQLAGLKTELVR